MAIDQNNSNAPEAAAAGALVALNQRLDQIDQLLADQEKVIQLAFRDFVTSVGSDAVVARVVERIEARDLEGAMKIVDSYVARMGNVIPRVFQNVGEATVPEMIDLATEAAPYMPRLSGPPTLPALPAPTPGTTPPAGTPPSPPAAPPATPRTGDARS